MHCDYGGEQRHGSQFESAEPKSIGEIDGWEPLPINDRKASLVRRNTCQLPGGATEIAYKVVPVSRGELVLYVPPMRISAAPISALM